MKRTIQLKKIKPIPISKQIIKFRKGLKIGQIIHIQPKKKKKVAYIVIYK